MKVQIKSDKTKTVTIKYRTVKLSVGKFIVTDSYTDGKLTSQLWSVTGGFKRTHPDAYKPKSMRFKYYDDISFLDTEECCDITSFHEETYTTPFVTDWTKFKGLNHVLCNWLGMDGNIYRIDKPEPVKLWRHQDYITGFRNATQDYDDNPYERGYDLKQVSSILKKKSWIRNVQIVKIPYYNQDSGQTHAVEFDYKLSSKKELKNKLGGHSTFKNHYFG